MFGQNPMKIIEIVFKIKIINYLSSYNCEWYSILKDEEDNI